MDDFNKDELNAPSWMSNKFFEEVLRKCENDDSISVKEVKITPATVKGDHYASVMFRAAISYRTSDSKEICKSLIIKTMPELEGHKMDMFGESYIFETEISMYSKTIPQFEAELRKIGDDTVLGAKAVYYSLEPKKCIIFEDVVPKGYETLRDRLANMAEAKAALLKLAKWHAVSYKLAAEGDKSVTEYREGLFNMKGFETMPIMTSGMENFIEKIDTIDELKIYVPKLRAVQKDLIQRCVASFESYRAHSPKGIFVLCHGDFHVKNMMFKRNNKDELEDVLLVDFQFCYFGPAVLDLMYAVYVLVSEDLRTNHRDELIYYYCSNFIGTLKKLHFQGEYPKISDFYIEIFRHRHFELFLFVSFLAIWYAFGVRKVDPEEVMNSDEARKRFYDNVDFIKEVKRLLPIMLHTGYLE